MAASAQALKPLLPHGIRSDGSQHFFLRLKSFHAQCCHTTIQKSHCTGTSLLLRPDNMQQSIFLLEEPHAKHSVSQDSEKDWMIRVATSPLNLVDWPRDLIHVGSSGKTSPEFCPVTEDGTLVASSGCFQNSGLGTHTGLWTLNFSESPRTAEESSLSDIVETSGVPRRHYLSEKALRGITRRLETKSKLPEMRELILAVQAIMSHGGMDEE